MCGPLSRLVKVTFVLIGTRIVLGENPSALKVTWLVRVWVSGVAESVNLAILGNSQPVKKIAIKPNTGKTRIFLSLRLMRLCRCTSEAPDAL